MFGPHSMRWLALVVCGVVTVAGCSSETSQSETGSLSLALTLVDGFDIDEVSWTITGGEMPDMSGVVDTSAPDSTASVEVFGIPEGDGYLITMEATSTDGDLSCKGSANFDITAGAVTDVHVMLNCTLPEQFGGVRVNGKFNVCTVLTKAVVAPLQTSVGNDIDLQAEAHDHEGDPIAYQWSASNGSIANPNAATTTYTCTQAGNDVIRIAVSDDQFDYCISSWSVLVTCVPGDGGDPCEGVTCQDDGNECTNEACNPSNGQCESLDAGDGTVCDGGAGSCMSGQCVDTNPCNGVVCEDDGNECTIQACSVSSGQCESADVNDGTDCDGGDGTCMNGVCVGTDRCEGVTCSDDGNECTTEGCNPITGSCDSNDVPNGTSCDGGNGMCMNGQCSAIDQCLGVVCPGDGNECTTEACNPSTGLCDSSNVPMGTECNGRTGICVNGDCVEVPTALSVVKTAPPSVFSEQQFNFQIEITNIGSATAINVEVSDTLPTEGSFVSSDPAGSVNSGVLTIPLGDLEQGETVNVTVTWLAPNALTTLVNQVDVVADNAAASSSSTEVTVGVQGVGSGGVTMAGTALRHRSGGDIIVDGVPAGATVTRAVLVWALLYQSPVPNNQITFEGELITADLTQTISANLCWGDRNTIGFAADVSDLVFGNGTYTVSDPVNGIIREDSNPAAVFPVTDGATLVVFYGGPGFNDQVISDFSYSAEDTLTVVVNERTIEGIQSTGGLSTLYIAGPDGQTDGVEEVRFMGAGTLNFDGAWDGSDPIRGPDLTVGNLWDTDAFDVSSILPPGQTFLDIELGFGFDCTGVSAVVLQVEQ